MRYIVIGFLVFLLLNLLFGGVLTQYTLEYWMSQDKGEPVHLSFVKCAIAGVFLGEVMLPAAVVTWAVSS